MNTRQSLVVFRKSLPDNPYRNVPKGIPDNPFSSVTKGIPDNPYSSVPKGFCTALVPTYQRL